MAATAAEALAPGLVLAESDPAADAAALHRLAAWCLRHISPLVAPSGGASSGDAGGQDWPEICDGLWIDVTGCAHLHGGEGRLLAGLVARLAAAGCTARAAVADTPGAAHALARYAAGPVTVIAPGETAAALAPLAVAALRLPEATIDGLHRLGLDHIGALAAAPRAPLARRFGPHLLHRLDQAFGRVPEPIMPMALPELIRARQGFAEPLLTAEALARAIGLLARAVCDRLLRAGQGARRLDLVCQRSDGSAQILQIGTALPSRDPGHLTRLLTARLETIDPGFGVEAMLLVAPVAEPLPARQLDTPLDPAGEGPSSDDPRPPGMLPAEDLAGLIDTLANRLGPRRLYRWAAVESDVPERALRRIPPLAPPAGAGWPAALPRPARLFAPPCPVQVTALLPDYPPVQFVWRRRPHRIRRTDGPERIHGEWWKHPDEFWAFRDYFQVEDEAGQRFWLFRSVRIPEGAEGYAGESAGQWGDEAVQEVARQAAGKAVAEAGGEGVPASAARSQWFLHGLFG